MNNWMYESRITVVTGHLGSGKTEFALNLALKLSSAGFSAALADLDVVNPYFRSREQKEFLEAHKSALSQRLMPALTRTSPLCLLM